MPYANVNGTRLYYDVQGQGTPIVFIHPPLITGKCFTCQQTGLAEDHKTIIFDIRGHGDSPPSDTPLTYELIAEDIRQLLNALDIDQAYLCGYSTGGSVALEALLSYPDRIKGAVIVSGMSETTDVITNGLIWLASRLSYSPLSKLLAYSFATGNTDASMPDMKAQLYDSAIKGHMPNVRQYFEYSRSYTCTDRLCSIYAPLLLIYGGNDFVFRRYGELLHRQLPSSSLVIIPHANHQLPLKCSVPMNERIRSWIAHQERDHQEELSNLPNRFIPSGEAPRHDYVQPH